MLGRIEVVGGCGVNAGPIVFVPASAGIVPYLNAHVTLAVASACPRTLKRGSSDPFQAVSHPLQRGCDQRHLPGKMPGQRRGARDWSLNINDACMPGPAATTAAWPGAVLFRPVTKAPASVAMIQPAARSHGFRPAS